MLSLQHNDIYVNKFKINIKRNNSKDNVTFYLYYLNIQIIYNM